MDKYDPQKKIALVVDEWGAWHAPLPGSKEGFLVQQNSLRDAILASLNLNIFARHADRVRIAERCSNDQRAAGHDHHGQGEDGPDPDVSRFQDVRAFPGGHVRGHVQRGQLHARRRYAARVDALAAKDAAGTLWLAVTNIDPTRPVEVAARLVGISGKSAAGETLTAAAVDSVNTVETPRAVTPKPISAKVQGDRLTLTLEPRSVTILSVRQ